MIIEKQLTKTCSTFEFYNTFVNEVLVPLSNANIISQLTYPETINDAKAMKDGNIIGIANNTFENYITFKFFNNIVNVSIDILSTQSGSSTLTHYIFNNLKITNMYNNNVKYENKHTLRSINSYTTSSTTVDNYVIDVITQHIMNIKVITNKNNIYIKMYGNTEYNSSGTLGFMVANILINKNDNIISFIHKSGQTGNGITDFSDMYNYNYCKLFIDTTGNSGHGNSKYTDTHVPVVSGTTYNTNFNTTFGGATTDNQMGLLYTGYKGIITPNSSTDIIIGDVKCLVGTADTNDIYYIHSLPGVYDCTTVTPETYYRLSTGVGNQTKLYYAIASNTLMEVDET